MRVCKYVLLLAFGVITAVPAHAIDREQGLERVREQLMESCSEGGLASCLGFDTAQCASLAEQVVQACSDQFAPGEKSTDAFGECIGRQARQRTGVTEAEMQACQSQIDGEAHGPEDLEEAKRKLEDAKSLMAKDAADTVGDVPLPLYPNRELTAHHQDASRIRGIDGEPLGEDAVAVVMMTSPDPVEDVVAFYDDRLDGFTRYRAAADDVTFAKDMPVDIEPSDFGRWMKALPLHEHVAIYRLSGETHIEVGYRPD